MLKRILAVMGLLLIGAIVFTVAWIVTHEEGSAMASLSTGRSVRVTATGWYLNLATGNDTATVDTPGHTIVIAPASLSVDGVVVAPIPVAAKAVEVSVKGDEIELAADGVLILPPQIAVAPTSGQQPAR